MSILEELEFHLHRKKKKKKKAGDSRHMKKKKLTWSLMIYGISG